jgi:uncharacterized protein (TIGR03086 family)
MSETSERFRTVADAFTDRIAAVPSDRWDRPAPCEDWVARDIIEHVLGSMGGFLERFDLALPAGPDPATDPLGAWTSARGAIEAALADPQIASRTFDSPMGTMSFEQLVGAFGVGDVLIHTWDLARAVGLDEQLDADEVRRIFQTMEANDEMMRQGTAFGPKVPVADDADEQTRLIAFTGRNPDWQPPA